MAALGLYGSGTSTGMVTYNSLLQAHVPSHHRGRVSASFDMIWQTGRLLSLGLGGLTADGLGIQAVYLLGGALLLLAGLTGLTGLRSIKTKASGGHSVKSPASRWYMPCPPSGPERPGSAPPPLPELREQWSPRPAQTAAITRAGRLRARRAP
jgi:MFS family permease